MFGDSLEQVGVVQLCSQGLFVYIVINVLCGFDECIYYVWMFNGKEFDCIVLDIYGGCKEGYWVWIYKQNFFGDLVGYWQVKVFIEVGQMIGILCFDVIQ